jgi:sporulation protein YlmC with PRC-barrel domain
MLHQAKDGCSAFLLQTVPCSRCIASLKLLTDTERRARQDVFSASVPDQEETIMLAKYLAAGVAGSMLLASAAFAAETTTTDAASKTQASATDTSFQDAWRASKLVGLNVYNDQNENVGSINDLLMDKSGNIKAAVISVGGFLGMGSRLVALPYEKIKFSNAPVAYTGVSGAPNTAGAKPPMSSTTTTGSTANPPAGAATAKANPWYPDHAMLNATKDELTNMPEFNYSE